MAPRPSEGCCLHFTTQSRQSPSSDRVEICCHPLPAASSMECFGGPEFRRRLLYVLEGSWYGLLLADFQPPVPLVCPPPFRSVAVMIAWSGVFSERQCAFPLMPRHFDVRIRDFRFLDMHKYSSSHFCELAVEVESPITELPTGFHPNYRESGAS